MGNQQNHQYDPSKDTVVIVGAGPVGLWTAIQLKYYNPNLRVVVFEKREQYVREHVLIIRRDALETSKIYDPVFEQFKSEISGKVPTKLLEEKFKEYALKKNVMVISGVEIKSLQDIYAKNIKKESLLAVIGCDGRRSTIRTQFMSHPKQGDDKWAFKKLLVPAVFVHEVVHRDWAYKMLASNPLSSMMKTLTIKKKNEKFNELDAKQNMVKESIFLNQVMIKYHVEGKGEKMEKVPYYKTLKLMKYPVTEVVGKYQAEQNRTPVTAVFIVPDEVAEKLNHFTPWNPGKFGDITQIDEQLKDSINIWFNAKVELCKEKVIVDSEKINYVPISVYSSTIFVEQNDGIIYALAGDSAFGVPYFRALNNGFECGTQLAWQIGKLFKENQGSNNNLQVNMENYAKFMRDRVYEEYTRAHRTTFQYKTQMIFVKVNGQVPWDFVKWYDGDFKKRVHEDFDPKNDEEIKQREEAVVEINPEEYGEEVLELAKQESVQSQKEEAEQKEIEQQIINKYQESKSDSQYAELYSEN